MLSKLEETIDTYNCEKVLCNNKTNILCMVHFYKKRMTVAVKMSLVSLIKVGHSPSKKVVLFTSMKAL